MKIFYDKLDFVKIICSLAREIKTLKQRFILKKNSVDFQLDINRHNSQYPPIEVSIYRQSHDRFLIINDKIYHIGAFVKDLGRKLCATMLMESTNVDEVFKKKAKLSKIYILTNYYFYDKNNNFAFIFKRNTI